ncbi:hypothetical protein HYV64_05175 [Candidatus Shapirobacteria bacterium]|nr:hypothetical protein [Candidatus Shapirobacteria bacterium]
MVEAIHGTPAVDYYGSGGQETYFIEAQVVDYVSRLHVLGVCLDDVADVAADLLKGGRKS